jgi:predicted ArsR family transcriptional regulator
LGISGHGPNPEATGPVAPISKARAGVLDRLRATPGPRGVEELATESGQHANTVREHLDALEAAGLATRTTASRTGRGRPASLYTAAMPDPAPAGYAALVVALAHHITATSEDPAAAAESAGRQWARSLNGSAHSAPGPSANAPIPSANAPIPSANAPIPSEAVQLRARREVAGTLNESGFGVLANDDATELTLTTCPIVAAARENPEVVCSVHLGLAKGLLEGRGVSAQGATLAPFAVPGGCRLSLPAGASD